MQIRDRIKELRRVPARELVPHPKNWRTHPAAQQDALRGVLAEVGYADALLAYERGDGTLQLIDGHLRAETTPDCEVPVLVLDVNDEEAEKILLTHDPLTSLAGADREQLDNLSESVRFQNARVSQMIAEMREAEAETPSAFGAVSDRPEVAIPESYQVVVECESETQQQEVFERMREEGYRCRVLTL